MRRNIPKIQQSKKCEYCKKEFMPFEGVNTKYWKLSKFCNRSCSALSRKEMYRENCKKIGKLPTSKEEREKISKNMKGKNEKLSHNWRGGLPKCIDCNKQLKTYRAKRCIQCSNKYRSGKNHHNFNKPLMSRELLRKGGLKSRKILSLRKPTSIEKKVYNELERRGLLFETQKLINGKFLVDAYIPSLNLIIEADGDYWHKLDRIKKKDKAENAYLKKCGFNLMRWRGADILNDINNLSKQLDNYS